MSDDEINRIFRYLEQIDKRLAALERREAARQGADEARSMTKGQVIGWVMGIAAVVGAASALAGQVINQL
jgi:hypothetical protein